MYILLGCATTDKQSCCKRRNGFIWDIAQHLHAHDCLDYLVWGVTLQWCEFVGAELVWLSRILITYMMLYSISLDGWVPLFLVCFYIISFSSISFIKQREPALKIHICRILVVGAMVPMNISFNVDTHLLQLLSQQHARPAPGGVEVNDHWHGAFLNCNLLTPCARLRFAGRILKCSKQQKYSAKLEPNKNRSTNDTLTAFPYLRLSSRVAIKRMNGQIEICLCNEKHARKKSGTHRKTVKLHVAETYIPWSKNFEKNMIFLSQLFRQLNERHGEVSLEHGTQITQSNFCSVECKAGQTSSSSAFIFSTAWILGTTVVLALGFILPIITALSPRAKLRVANRAGLQFPNKRASSQHGSSELHPFSIIFFTLTAQTSTSATHHTMESESLFNCWLSW